MISYQHYNIFPSNNNLPRGVPLKVLLSHLSRTIVAVTVNISGGISSTAMSPTGLLDSSEKLRRKVGFFIGFIPNSNRTSNKSIAISKRLQRNKRTVDSISITTTCTTTKHKSLMIINEYRCITILKCSKAPNNICLHFGNTR